MEKKFVKLKNTNMLADNILTSVKGKKLFIVSEQKINTDNYYILENPEGIRVKIIQSNCEVITNKKNK